MSNPFRYSEPVSPAELIDRDQEAEALSKRAEGGHNSRLVAPRRYGKTSLLLRVCAEADRFGWAAVTVNFFGCVTLADVALRIERAYDTQLRGPLAAWWTGIKRTLSPTVGIRGGPISAEVAAHAADSQDSHRLLLERLALPPRLMARDAKRTLVVFDEFQDVLAAGGQADAIIRSEIETHGDAASYIFAGSHPGMMRELFADKRRAFYGQAGAVALGPLAADDVAEYVAARFSETGKNLTGEALGLLLDLAQGHPQRTMLLAHFLWERTVPGGQADERQWQPAFDDACEVAVDELRAIWSSLTVTERRVLVTVTAGQRLFSRASSAGLPRSGSVRSAVKKLVDSGELVEDDQATSGYRFSDPLFAWWIANGQYN